MGEPMEISLTDFVDFTIAAGQAKVTKVDAIRKRPEYHPALDFWRSLRDGIIEYHSTAHSGKQFFDDLVAALGDPKKMNRYRFAAAGYQRFLGRKMLKWFDPPRSVWSPGKLAVKVNPELGLKVGDQPHVIKLYFKDDKLSKRRVDVVTGLMSEQLSAGSPRGTHFSILDVPSGKLIDGGAPNTRLLPLLMGEAASFVTIWEALDAVYEGERRGAGQ